MLYEGYVAAEIYKQKIQRAERDANRMWRFRNIKSRESQIATAILTSVLALFVR